MWPVYDSLLFQSQEASRNERNAVRQYGDGGSSSCRANCQQKVKEKEGVREMIVRK